MLEMTAATIKPAFTGTFIGMCGQDLTGQQLFADFDWFEYEEVF